MHFYLYILLYAIFLPKNLTREVEIQCPSHCKCDMFEKLKRASCMNHNLAVIQSNLPQQTQLLDISFNQISHLYDHVFLDLNLLSLKLLNISHNKVSQIQMNAFSGLNKLKSLDLSHNALQYILKHWFWSLSSLEELYLRGNSFVQIKGDDAVFESTTLKKLDLSKSQIIHLEAVVLANLPNLEVLDVSENYLMHLNVAVIKPLKNLNVLNTVNNTFSCDAELKKLTVYCTKNGIRFQDPCKKNASASEKFQRIINMVEEDEKNSWIYEEEENIKNITIIERCNDTRNSMSLLQEIVDLSPALSISIPFIYGIAVGILATSIYQTCSKKRQNLSENTYVSFDQGDSHLRRRSRFGRTISSEDQESLQLKEWKLSESTPVLFRKNQVNF